MKAEPERSDREARRADARILIAGDFRDGASQVPIYDKYTRAVRAAAHIPSRAQTGEAVRVLHDAFAENRLTPYERGAILARAGLIIERRGEELVEVLQAEAGFTRADALGEISRCVETFRLCAEEARRLAGEIVPIGGAPQQKNRLGLTLRVPLGVTAAITPFNAPLNTVAHKVGPAIAAGNPVLVKPSLHTPSPANLLASALLEAGLPPGLIAVLHGGGEVVRWIADEPKVRFFAFTGSTEVGAQIQQYAGLRRTQMELGSIAFTYVADDADLDAALPKVVNAAYRKAGQVRTSVQNLLVQTQRMAEVEHRLAPMAAAMAAGDPRDPQTRIGPVISPEAAERIDAWIDEALAGGARVGSVIPATLLADLPPLTPVGCREVFGPVMSLVPVASLDEAIERINSTPYGLAAGVFTNRMDDAIRAAHALQVGNVFINEASSARVDLMPYGGSKDSGFGREGPRHAVREMTEERLVTFTTN